MNYQKIIISKFVSHGDYDLIIINEYTLKILFILNDKKNIITDYQKYLF